MQNDEEKTLDFLSQMRYTILKKGRDTLNVMIIDTETTNGLDQPMPYDVGYQIVNLPTGEVLVEKSFIIAEIFLDKEMMGEAFFKDKIPTYWREYKEGKRNLKSIWNVRRELWQDMKNFDVKKVGAYNMGFDNRATRNDIRFCTSSRLRWFFPYGTELFCIWNMACTSILQDKNYINFCEKNGFISENKNYSTSAETVYRYLINNPTFEEEHTGLEDVKIEVEIMLAVLRSGLEYEDKISFGCWRKVQTFARALAFTEGK